MNRTFPATILSLGLLLAGCAESSFTSGEAGQFNSQPTLGTDQGASQVRVDVFPGQVIDANGNVRALPQTLGPFDRFGETLNVGTITLSAPGTLSGGVTGQMPTPWADGAQIPNEPGPVEADILISIPGSVQSYSATTDEDGLYEAIVVPSEISYDVVAIPTDPTVPFGVAEVVFRGLDEVQDFELGLGVSLYGRVLTGTYEPVQGARVQAVDPSGASSVWAYTDSSGWYTLQVQPGVEYDVICAGRDHGRDPILTSAPVLAEEDIGGRVDFDYPNLSGTFAAGRVVGTDGIGISGATVRFTATDLQGYDALPAGFGASLVVEDTTDGNGNFDASLIDGSYTVEFLPPEVNEPAIDRGPVAFAVESDTSSLGDVVLPDLVAVSGSTIGDGRVICTEQGFGQRSWSTFASNDGSWDLELPPTVLDCQVQPPGEFANRFAWTTTEVTVSASDAFFDLEVREGAEVRGVVELAGVPESFGLVEVRDGLGRLLGSTVTGSDTVEGDQPGAFFLRVDLPEEEE